MTSTKRRFFLAGGLSVAIAIVLGIMLGMSALAAPSSRVRGTLELTDGTDPITIISPDTAVATADHRIVTVTVKDDDFIKDMSADIPKKLRSRRLQRDRVVQTNVHLGCGCW